MSRWDMDGLRILAQYVRKRNATPEPGAGPFAESLRVDGPTLIPRADPKYCVRISLKDDPNEYRLPLPADFNRQNYSIIMEAALPVSIPYGADATRAIIETDRRGEKVLAQPPLRYRTV